MFSLKYFIGSSHETDIAQATRFAIEVAKEFTKGTELFYEVEEFAHLKNLYGDFRILQTLGHEVSSEAIQ